MASTMSRVAAVLSALLLLAQGAAAGERVPGGDISEKKAAPIFNQAFRLIREHGLLSARDMECVTVMLVELEGTTAHIQVHEKHSRKCGGDPEVAPRLFSMEIDLKTGAAGWDGDDSDFEMRPLPRKSSRRAPVPHRLWRPGDR